MVLLLGTKLIKSGYVNVSDDLLLQCVSAECLFFPHFQAGCHVLVATPGRLMDFVNRGRVAFSSVRFVVLDEADRMLDMGFLPEMEKMMNHPTMTPKVCLNLFHCNNIDYFGVNLFVLPIG